MNLLFASTRVTRAVVSALAVLFAVSQTVVAADAAALASKLDAQLRVMAESPDVALTLFPESVQFAQGLEKSAASASVAVTIRLGDAVDAAASIAALRDAGASIGSQLGNILTAQVPLRSLSQLVD